MDAYYLNNTVSEFCRRLRREGLRLNQSHTLRAIKVLNQIDLLNKEEFYLALRSVLCFGPEEYRSFDRVFRGFWGEQVPYAGEERKQDDQVDDQNADNAEEHEPSVQEVELDLSGSGPSFGHQEDNEEITVFDEMQQDLQRVHRIYSYSPDENLIFKEFATHSLTDYMAKKPEWEPFLALLKKSVKKDSLIRGKNQIDIKKTIRKNIQYGGSEWFHLHKRGKSRNEKQILFTLADISGSMEAYTKIYLPVLYLLHRYVVHAEMFFFNTKIHSVTKYFKQRYGQTLELLNDRLRMLSNGTNLGQCLRQFRKQYSSRLSPELTTLLIFSDGWDRGDMEQLEYEIGRLSRQIHQIIWINPLLGTTGYQPETQALKTVQPYLSHMVSVHDYEPLTAGKQLKWRVK